MGRTTVKIDWGQFDKLCALQCTSYEIGEWFHCSHETINKKCLKEQGIGFVKYYEKKSAGGRIALRRNLMQMSETNVAAAIFLAKNYLGMSDRQEIAHSGNINTNNPEELTDAELTAILLRRRNRRGSGDRIAKETPSPLASD